jgi:hypothetical protein
MIRRRRVAHRAADLVAVMAAGAGEVERQRRERDPRRVRGVVARRQVRQRAVLELGDDLLDGRVVAVALVGVDPRQSGVGHERVGR